MIKHTIFEEYLQKVMNVSLWNIQLEYKLRNGDAKKKQG